MSNLTLDLRKSAFALMDKARDQLLAGEVDAGMTHLTEEMTRLRSEAAPAEWRHFAEKTVLEHPLTALLHQDPFTRHSFQKPRGYAGDAELLDYIYGIKAPPADTTELGHQIFRYSTNTPAPQSVRSRRDILGAKIDEVAVKVPEAHMMSVACGHLREAGLSHAIRECRVAEFFALDQDPVSLAEVAATLCDFNVQPVQGSVRTLLTGKTAFPNLDLVYAAGLYDYLEHPVATRLTRRLFEMLRPGGRLLIANFAPHVRDTGYMETFMAWSLLYRNEDVFETMSEEIRPADIAKRWSFCDEHENVIFLEMIKC